MEILVHLDQQDIEKIKEVIQKVQEKDAKIFEIYQIFWSEMVNKYRILQNRRVALNLRDKNIFEWASQLDLSKFQNGFLINE